MEDEQEEEEINEMILEDVTTDEEMDEPELIHPYEAPGSPYPPPPLSDTSSDSELETEEVATVGTIKQIPIVRRRFSSSIHERGGSSSAPVAYELEDLVPRAMRRDIDSLHGKVRVLERQMRVRETEGECSLSWDKVVHSRMDLLDWDMSETKGEVKWLGKHFQMWDDEGVRAENKRLKQQLNDVKLSRTIHYMTNDRLERDLYELRCWAYTHYQEMVRIGDIAGRSHDVTDVLAKYGETSQPKPPGSPCDNQ